MTFLRKKYFKMVKFNDKNSEAPRKVGTMSNFFHFSQIKSTKAALI